MTHTELLSKLFPQGRGMDFEEGKVFAGRGKLSCETVTFIGTKDRALIGISEILSLSSLFLKTLKSGSKEPVLMLVDNNGQKMGLMEEALGLFQYIAHLIKLQDALVREGRKLLSLVYGNSMAGGFIAFGLCAPVTYAVKDAETSVMALDAMSRVTKLPVETLRDLGKNSSVFAPGTANFLKTGGLRGIWDGDLSAALEKALRDYDSRDRRQEWGFEHGGRVMARKISCRISGKAATK